MTWTGKIKAGLSKRCRASQFTKCSQPTSRKHQISIKRNERGKNDHTKTPEGNENIKGKVDKSKQKKNKAISPGEEKDFHADQMGPGSRWFSRVNTQ